MKGYLNRDVEHYNPRCNARGVIKKGIAVHQVTHNNWTGQWVVSHRRDAPHMSEWDFQYSYVDVPADAVDVEGQP